MLLAIQYAWRCRAEARRAQVISSAPADVHGTAMGDESGGADDDGGHDYEQYPLSQVPRKKRKRSPDRDARAPPDPGRGHAESATADASRLGAGGAAARPAESSAASSAESSADDERSLAGLPPTVIVFRGPAAAGKSTVAGECTSALRAAG